MNLRFVFSFFVTFLVILIFHFTQIRFVKFYPVWANFTIFLIFFISLFAKDTVIQKIAKKLEGELDEFTKNYTRNLTYIWCVFTFFNFIISIITIFLSEKLWVLYNGFISYLAIATLFVVEYIVRIVLRKKYKK